LNGQESETIAIMGCRACGVGIPQSDRFCRLCGAGHTDSLSATLSNQERPVKLASSDSLECSRPPADCATMAMPTRAGYGPLSGPLVTAVADGLSANLALRFLDRRVKRILLVLISVPIWLMIVLLSPLDTYAAVKASPVQRGESWTQLTSQV
jgi:hypothetical protein